MSLTARAEQHEDGAQLGDEQRLGDYIYIYIYMITLCLYYIISYYIILYHYI